VHITLTSTSSAGTSSSITSHNIRTNITSADNTSIACHASAITHSGHAIGSESIIHVNDSSTRSYGAGVPSSRSSSSDFLVERHVRRRSH
jgi:hypothetical protein